ncbi:MAG: HlyD family secretion protein [Spirochaetaceae bacterium]
METRGNLGPARRHRTPRGGPLCSVTLFALFALLVLLVSGCAGEEDGIEVSGTVEARTITLSARTPGELVERPAEEGSEVAAGKLLARIDDEEPRLAKRRAEAGVAVAEAELSLLREGAAAEDVRQAEAAVEEAREELQLARRELDRTERLFEADGVSRSEYERMQTRVNQARARLDSAEAALEKARGPARVNEIEAARARLDQARASLESAETRLAHTRISSPIEGTVITTAREVGEFVPTGAPVVEVADLSEVTIDVYVSEPKLAELRLGGQAKLMPDGTSEVLDGTVAFISPRAEFTPTNVQTDEQRATLVYRVKIQADNPDRILKIGMPVAVRIPTEGEDGDT